MPYIGVGTEQHLYRHVSGDTATDRRTGRIKYYNKRGSEFLNKDTASAVKFWNSRFNYNVSNGDLDVRICLAVYRRRYGAAFIPTCQQWHGDGHTFTLYYTGQYNVYRNDSIVYALYLVRTIHRRWVYIYIYIYIYSNTPFVTSYR